ncbi:MAG: hypothetical protein OXE59_06900 [Bacteroidetes bacterium]|nr:hypothetical protein [Bacteroidota bacterium]MCY4233449.1 hypothetical protein [Bacteroidota bacterium]
MEATEISPRDTGKRFKFSRKGAGDQGPLERTVCVFGRSGQVG